MSRSKRFTGGVYIKVFPGQLLAGYLYPAMACGQWHLVRLKLLSLASR
jgi:hypothetical protein